MKFRKADEKDALRIWEIILQAKQQMREMNSTQWGDDYPTRDTLQMDILKGYGYVICDESSKVIVYGAVCFDGEPAYDSIVGRWTDNFPYVTVHRLAVADEKKRQGMAAKFIREVEKLCLQREIRSFRIDTNFDNIYMLQLLEKSGFEYCGEVIYPRGARRAYHKSVEK
ncbi:MAG: GNAT family N-acetyltransferase [Prevotellaceae bacterium]|jgi:GNAT superfamily N-acetyltransferase|nr:GNAT family N-acetyltransferase [Prevotellaceae bacterium]